MSPASLILSCIGFFRKVSSQDLLSAILGDMNTENEISSER